MCPESACTQPEPDNSSGLRSPVTSQDARRTERPDKGAQLTEQVPVDGREADRTVHVDRGP
eukprot:7322998-Pyramimonas_sp.AAC.1